MEAADIRELEQALSLERFGRYLGWAAGDRPRAVELYTLNTQLSECLYTPLQMLEIALRNRIHVVMSQAVHEHWYDEHLYQLSSSQAEQVAKAKADLAHEGKTAMPGRVVAALTFGYWTAFFNTAYEDLWRRQLRKIVTRPPGRPLRRKDFSFQLTPIRRLRNRIAHHEPILEQNLPRLYGNMVQLTGWLSPVAATWCQDHSRFDSIYPSVGVLLHRPARGAP